MFSETNTVTNSLPRWTENVSPTMSGMIIEAREYVLIGAREPCDRARFIFFCSLGSTNGPFFIDLVMSVEFLYAIIK